MFFLGDMVESDTGYMILWFLIFDTVASVGNRELGKQRVCF